MPDRRAIGIAQNVRSIKQIKSMQQNHPTNAGKIRQVLKLLYILSQFLMKGQQ